MGKEESTKKLKDWINTLSVGKYPDVRKKIIDRCGISAYIYNNWLAEKSRIPYLAKKEINEIASEEKLEKPFKEIA